MAVMTEGKTATNGKVKVKDGKPAIKPDEIIDLTAEGISQEDYLAAVRGIADAINDIRAKHEWCWVYVKFAAALNPLITQGKRLDRDGTGTFAVKVNEPRPEDRYPREWFNEEGWAFYDKVNQDGERMKELRRTYGRILKIVQDRRITMDEAQSIFERAHLPLYGAGRPWTGTVEIYTRVHGFASGDIIADKEKIRAAWKKFLAETGLEDYDGYPAFTGNARIVIDAADTEALIGNPMRDYDPAILPDGTRLADPDRRY